MGIIHLKGSTTKDKESFENQKRSFNSKILISHIDDGEDVSVDDFSIDITLGKSWNENYSYNDRSLFLIEEECISIKPRSSVVVSIREKITIPNNMFGLVISTGSIFLQYGVQSPTAKIEAGYSGVLVLRLVNYSDTTVKIKKGDKIASMIFLRTEHTPTHTFATNSESTNIRKKRFFEKSKVKIANFLVANIFVIISTIIAVIGCFISILNYNNSRIQSTQPIQKAEIVQEAQPVQMDNKQDNNRDSENVTN